MIEISTSGTATTVTISGDLDLAGREQFPEITARVVSLHRQLLVVDLCDVTFVDSTGAAFLIALADSTRRHHGAAVLRGTRPHALLVLDACGALGLFRVDHQHDCSDDQNRTNPSASN